LKNSDISLNDAEAGINKKISWTIPNDYKTTVSAINQGKALSQIASQAPTTKSLKDLADFLMNGEEGHKRKDWKFLRHV
jgi:pilus assembly protein CpaE